MWNLVKGPFQPVLGCAGLVIAVIVVIGLLYVGLTPLPLDFAGILGVFGIWMTVGIFFGGKGRPSASENTSSDRGILQYFFCLILFVLIVLMYLIKAERNDMPLEWTEVLGLTLLGLGGMIAGIIAAKIRNSDK